MPDASCPGQRDDVLAFGSVEWKASVSEGFCPHDGTRLDPLMPGMPWHRVRACCPVCRCTFTLSNEDFGVVAEASDA